MAESRRGNPASFKRRRRRWIKQQGKRLIRALWDFFGQQSLIGAPSVWPSDVFPSVRPLEENWHLIRRELDALLVQRDLLPPFQTISRDQRRIAKGDRWKTFILVGFGSWSLRSVRRCPETARLLAGIPDLQTAFFSILAPGYHIPPHRGITRGLVRVHLAVKVPTDGQKCRIRIDRDEHHWQEGKCLVFDDTFEHEVWNETDEERVVLLLDIKRPMRWPGRLVNEIFLWGIRRSAYFTRAQIRQGRWEDRFEAAVTRADNYHLDA
ncbi:MAG: aspartyl/asparaginyl beta-hydroxylase domain-containing protein [Rhodospirillaceae bacterium]|nr:aspartyl/asparaginyl beta-hydroxylase domain-containing protein [Rhodospirillaceae bacterium]